MQINKLNTVYPTPNSTITTNSTINTGSNENHSSKTRKTTAKNHHRSSYDLYKRNPLPKNMITCECSTKNTKTSKNLTADKIYNSSEYFNHKENNKVISILNDHNSNTSATKVADVRNTNYNLYMHLNYQNKIGSERNLNQCYLYAPGESITKNIKFKILHTIINLNHKKEEDNYYYIEIYATNPWIIKKSQSQLNALSKLVVFKSNLNIASNLKYCFEICDRSTLQCFIITDIVKSFDFKSEYIYLYEKSKKLLNVKIANKTMFLYHCNKLYKIIKLTNCDVFPLSDRDNVYNGFVLFSNNTNYVMGCLTGNEKNEWIRFIRRIIYDV